MTGKDQSSDTGPVERRRGGPRSWRLGILALLSSLTLLLTAELVLRQIGALPPEDPYLFYARTAATDFTPFLETPAGLVGIKPAWVNREQVYQFRQGRRAGRYFLYPGFRPTQFSRAKDPAALRVFVLGDSTTFGLFVGEDRSYPALFRTMIAELLPDRAMEVVNLGCSGLDSDRIATLVDVVAGFAPDLIVVYAGHNEMLRGETAAQEPSLALQVRAKLLRFSAIAQWMNYFWLSRRGPSSDAELREEQAAGQAGEIAVYEPLDLPEDEMRPPSEAFRQRAAGRFADAIERMIVRTRAAAIPIIFVLPVSNLFEPPAISLHANDFQAHAEFDGLLREGETALREGRLEPARSLLARALALSPAHARAWHLRGLAHAALGRRNEALADLQHAIDADARITRLTSPLQEALIHAVEENGATWVDLRPVFFRDLTSASSRALFIDHVHPTPLGHALIAERVFAAATDTLRLAKR